MEVYKPTSSFLGGVETISRTPAPWRMKLDGLKHRGNKTIAFLWDFLGFSGFFMGIYMGFIMCYMGFLRIYS